MERVKTIRKIGTSLGVVFNKEEQQILGLKPGDFYSVSVKKYDIEGGKE